MGKTSGFTRAMLVIGFAFLYLPLICLVVYSFNASTLVTVWGGFSMKWYGRLMRNQEVLSAAWLSFRLAAVSSFVGVVLATFAGYALARIRRFRGSTLFAGMVSAPMVMPEVITGLSVLLLVFELQMLLKNTPFSFERGFLTIFFGHATLIMSYATVMVRARLTEIDEKLEQAAMDLGARPLKVFFLITLPLIAPALLSAFLLGITLSLDDLVIASFLSGPGSTTLPQVIFAKIRRGLDPQMNVLATLLIVVIGALVVAGNYVMMRSQAKRLDRKSVV